ncbi:MAG TPA: sigma-E factor negative regulatory protein [Burkholderiaceae bacterium]
METKDMTQEQISALLDSELGDAHIEVTLAALRRSEGRGTWDVYHQIGDVLRSEDMAQDFSSGFTARLLSRLDEEPPILAPVKQAEPQPAQLQQAVAGGARVKRFGIPLAVAAAAVFAIVAVPQMMRKADGGMDTQLGQQNVNLPTQRGGNIVLTGDRVGTAAPAATTTVADGAVLRDPRLDQYMMDHQRYSPAWNSSAEYARSATYTVTSDSNK